MTVTFFSNFFNHHQKPLGDELYHLLGDNYTFVATIPMPDSFSKSGYTDFSDTPYLLASYQNEENHKKAIQLGLESDVVVIGAASLQFIKERLKKNKLTFRYAERMFKKSNWQKLNPRAIINQYKKHTVYRDKNVHMLCASAYTANDLKWIMAYPNKMYKWGYFTKTTEIDIQQLITAKKNKPFSIIFVARLIDWKHPEMAIELAKLLKEKKYDFELNIIGSGVMENSLHTMINDFNLGDCVHMLGNIANEQVLQLMQTSHAFFFSSDRNEGWGAVANEAMANGCTLVASHEIGAIPYLVEPNKNGMVFKSGNINDAFNKMERLLKDRDYCDQLAVNAYKTITSTWSPKTAASNFLNLCANNSHSAIKKGPCSIAETTSSNWFKK